MSRETVSLLVFSVLAIVGVTASYQWMEAHSTLDAGEAWRQVRPAAQHLSQQKKSSLRLTQMTPPTGANTNWDFEFHTASRQKVHILVRENGTALAVQ
ncbi:hypothetical protein [Vampirovibrio chlorellavorus]|uniref:hypothetical protein n=1 Tax=Vampirovibrio chlorellavorus TaxID=758823 RepID=UPI0026F17242|nr:hypothetical protein [Vampirovibrio chlorellavorus]